MSRFNNLSESAKISVSKMLERFFSTAPKDLYLPVAPANTWHSILTKLNVRLRGDGLPVTSEIARAVEYLESQLGTSGVCERCSAD